MSLRTSLTVLVLLGALAAPASAETPVPAQRSQRYQGLDREHLRERIRQHIQQRPEFRRELVERLRDRRRQQLLDRIAERMERLHRRHEGGLRERSERRPWREHRWDGRKDRREFWRERARGRRSA